MAYYGADGLWSVTSLWNSSGAMTNSYVYDAFGELVTSAGIFTNPFQYTARDADTETGLYYYRARYYDPQTGRFLSEDPIRFNGGDINAYIYTSNDPINSIDPNGKSQQDVSAIISAASRLNQQMIDLGLKYPGSGWANNAIATGQYVNDGIALSTNIGLPFKMPFLGCGQQSSFVIEGLIPLKLHDNWTFDQPGEWATRQHLLYHQWVNATSVSNPNDPDIAIVPWNNQYQIVPKGGRPNPANWRPLTTGGK